MPNDTPAKPFVSASSPPSITSLLRGATFRLAAYRLDQLPTDDGREVAIVGRSNAGKSSALNRICDHTGLARVSKTPGRTREMVVFDLSPDYRLIDLPGYGYAQVSADLQAHWGETLARYFHERYSLAGLVLVMDIRRPLQERDRQMIDFCLVRSLPVHALLTKSDKLSRGAAIATEQQVRKAMNGRIGVQRFSSLKNEGIEEARKQIGEWLQSPRLRNQDAPVDQATSD